MTKIFSKVNKKLIEGGNYMKSDTCNPVATDEIQESNFHTIFTGFELIFAGASEEHLKKICSCLGDQSSYDVESGCVTFRMKSPIIGLSDNVERLFDFVDSNGNFFAKELGIAYEFSNLLTKIPDEFGDYLEFDSEFID